MKSRCLESHRLRLLPLLALGLLTPGSRFIALGSQLPAPSSPAAEASTLPDAIALFDAHRLPEAQAVLTDLVARQPDNARALWYLGKTNLALQQLDAAVSTLRRAAKLAPDDAPILADYGTACLLTASELGTSLKSIGYARSGRDALLQAVALAPDIIAYREGLVSFYSKAPGLVGGSIAKAYAQADEIAKRDPARSVVLRATILDSEKKYPEARAACEAMLHAQPDCYLALYTLGRIASETGENLDAGEKALRRCLELTPAVQEPDHSGVHYRLGLIAAKKNLPQVARAEYQAALRLQPVFPEVTEALAALGK